MDTAHNCGTCHSDFARSVFCKVCTSSNNTTSSKGNFEPFCLGDGALIGKICDFYWLSFGFYSDSVEQSYEQ